jgi:uncharacterized membrane protein YccC
MSFVVLAIAAAHALPPIIGAVLSKTKTGTIIGTVIGCLIAVASGNLAFVAADLIGVGIGTWLGLSIAGSK